MIQKIKATERFDIDDPISAALDLAGFLEPIIRERYQGRCNKNKSLVIGNIKIIEPEKCIISIKESGCSAGGYTTASYVYSAVSYNPGDVIISEIVNVLDMIIGKSEYCNLIITPPTKFKIQKDVKYPVKVALVDYKQGASKISVKGKIFSQVNLIKPTYIEIDNNIDIESLQPLFDEITEVENKVAVIAKKDFFTNLLFPYKKKIVGKRTTFEELLTKKFSGDLCYLPGEKAVILEKNKTPVLNMLEPTMIISTFLTCYINHLNLICEFSEEYSDSDMSTYWKYIESCKI